MANNTPFRSSADLVLEVLKNLGVLSVGQQVDPEDFTAVNDKLDALFRKLGGLEIVYVADPANIPAVWFADLSDIVAGEVASDFGVVGQEFIDKVNKGLGGVAGVEIGAGTAAQSLKIMTRGRPTYEPLRFLNY